MSMRGLWIRLLWSVEFTIRAITGIPLRYFSEVTPELYVSGQPQRRGWQFLTRYGITAVVNLRREYDDLESGISLEKYLHIKLEDNTAPSLDHLESGVVFIQSEIARGGKVFVHCAGGVGRAPTLAAAYLVSTGISSSEAWTTIQRVRPFIRPTPEQVDQVRVYAEQLDMKR